MCLYSFDARVKNPKVGCYFYMVALNFLVYDSS